MIRVEGIYKKFGKNEVLKKISLDLLSPGITAILGPNGSGKTTLIKSILGLIHPNEGNILFQNTPVHHSHKYRNQISYLPQVAHFPENLSPSDLIKMIKQLRKKDSREEYFIQLFKLEPELNKKMANLSGGNRQKVNILLSLLFDTPVIILDEPSAGLDPLAITNLKAHIREEKKKGKIIVITTHILNFVEELAENIVFLMEGDVYFNGSQQELLSMQDESRLEKAIANILQKNQL